MIECNLLKLPFFQIFTIKYRVELSLIFFGSAKQYYLIKTREIVTFLPPIDSLVTIRHVTIKFLLLNISNILSLNTIDILRFLFGLYSSIIL